jgi:signal transduction histidine kinase/ActR/RegA family two-component response regulator
MTSGDLTQELARELAQVGPGNHLCLVHETPAEQRAAVSPYVKGALARGERFVYLADARTGDEVARALEAAGVPVADAIRRGALVIESARDAYLRGGSFDPHAMLEMLRALVDAALADGHAGVAITGEMSWALGPEPGNDRLVEYEALLNRFFPGSRAHAICQYDRNRFPPELVAEVLRTHPTAVVGGLVCPNPFYEPPDLVLGERPAAERVAWRIELLRRARTQQLQLERSRAALAEADRRKDEFIAVLSHELRNPLAPIRHGVEILRALGPPDPRAARAVEAIGRQTDHLAAMVDDLLDVVRLVKGKVELRREPVELGALVRRVADDHAGTFERAGVALSVPSPAGDVWIDGDPVRLAQVLGNLLANAAKFSEAGGTTEVALRDSDGRAALSVRDDGLGFSPETAARLFQPFSQADMGLARTRGGLGLGLVLARELSERMGGEISAESAGEGRGAAFTVRFPTRPAPAVAAPGRAAAAGPPGRVRALVVEDNPDALETFRDLLELLGHEVAAAPNGAEALRVARGFEPQVVFCDIGLPDMSGYEVLHALRAARPGAPTTYVAMTGYARAEDRERARSAGFHHHLAKPARLDDLERILGDAGAMARA